MFGKYFLLLRGGGGGGYQIMKIGTIFLILISIIYCSSFINTAFKNDFLKNHLNYRINGSFQYITNLFKQSHFFYSLNYQRYSFPTISENNIDVNQYDNIKIQFGFNYFLSKDNVIFSDIVHYNNYSQNHTDFNFQYEYRYNSNNRWYGSWSNIINTFYEEKKVFTHSKISTKLKSNPIQFIFLGIKKISFSTLMGGGVSLGNIFSIYPLLYVGGLINDKINIIIGYENADLIFEMEYFHKINNDNLLYKIGLRNKYEFYKDIELIDINGFNLEFYFTYYWDLKNKIKKPKQIKKVNSKKSIVKNKQSKKKNIDYKQLDKWYKRDYRCIVVKSI